MITVTVTTVGLFLYAMPAHGYCAKIFFTLVLGQWLHDEVSRGLIKHQKSGARKTRLSGLFSLSFICTFRHASEGKFLLQVVKGIFLNLLLHMVLQHYVHLRGVDTWLLVLLVLPQHPSPILMQEHHGL